MPTFHAKVASLATLGILLGSVAAQAHDHTAKKFLQARAVAQAEAAKLAEAAPDEKSGERVCRLRVELTLDGQPTPGLLRVTNLATGKAIVLKDEIQREQNWCAIAGPTTCTVPQGKLKVEALHGIVTELATREVDLTGKESDELTLPLKRIYDPAARGLSAGNTHLHLMKLTFAEADRYLRVVPKADGLDLVFLSILRRIPDERDYISNTFTEGDLGRLSQGSVLFGNGQEHRHNFGAGGEGFGHVMLLNILKRIEPVSIGPGIMREGTDGIPLQRGIRTAREDGATILWCHNKFGHEDLPNWVSGLVHAQNIHDGGEHGSYEDTFYRYLNVGMKVPFSTGTDWFIYDFSRVYVPVAGELNSKSWLAALAGGKSYITNGPFLELAAGGKTIGDTIAAQAGDEITITGRALGRGNFQRIELVQNGNVVHSVPAAPKDGHFTSEMKFTLRADQPGWIALRIAQDTPKNEFGKPLFGHTSPIYLEVAGRSVFHRDVAEGMLREMATSRQFIKANAKFADAAEESAVLRVYDEGIVALKQRIDGAK
jgi:hypothetical protein